MEYVHMRVNSIITQLTADAEEWCNRFVSWRCVVGLFLVTVSSTSLLICWEGRGNNTSSWISRDNCKFRVSIDLQKLKVQTQKSTDFLEQSTKNYLVLWSATWLTVCLLVVDGRKKRCFRRCCFVALPAREFSVSIRTRSWCESTQVCILGRVGNESRGTISSRCMKWMQNWTETEEAL